jgi:hypothetical protein
MIKVILVKWWGVVQCVFLFVNRWERRRRRPVIIWGGPGLLSIDGRLWMPILVIRGIKCAWAHICWLIKERSGGLLGPEGAIYHRVTRPPLHIIRVIGTWVDLTTAHDSWGAKHHLLFWPASSCPEADSCGRIIGLHKSIGVCPANGVGLRIKCGFVGVLLATESTVLSNWSCCHCIKSRCCIVIIIFDNLDGSWGWLLLCLELRLRGCHIYLCKRPIYLCN